jgi:glycine dehydrogenase subunit 1
MGAVGGRWSDRWQLERLCDEHVSCVVVSYPNVFGVIEDRASEWLARQRGPHAHGDAEAGVGLLKSPGELGADVAEGEFGDSVSYRWLVWGSLRRERFLRNMPGLSVKRG